MAPQTLIKLTTQRGTTGKQPLSCLIGFPSGAPCGCRLVSGFDPKVAAEEMKPDWEIDPATLEIGPKVGEGEFGTVHKVRSPRPARNACEPFLKPPLAGRI